MTQPIVEFGDHFIFMGDLSIFAYQEKILVKAGSTVVGMPWSQAGCQKVAIKFLS